MNTSLIGSADPDLADMDQFCREWIVLSGPCVDLMTLDEWEGRHRAIRAETALWGDVDRTAFWYTMAAMWADINPQIQPVPGLMMSPENHAREVRRLTYIAYDLSDEVNGGEGVEVWGFLLYIEPLFGSFTRLEVSRYSLTWTDLVFPPE